MKAQDLILILIAGLAWAFFIILMGCYVAVIFKGDYSLEIFILAGIAFVINTGINLIKTIKKEYYLE